MFALNRVSVASEDPTYNEMAISLARTIHPRFSLDRTTPHPRMVWKVAMDMSRPLVRTQGHLDPIDGYVVFRLLQRTAKQDTDMLDEEIADYKRVMELSC